MNDFSILYIEDDKEVLENVTFLLNTYAQNIYTAEDGETALELYFKHKPDIVISDINIPKIDGLSVANKIRKENNTVPIIIMSAHTESDKLLKAIDIGVSSYVTKPFTLEDLKLAIEKAIDAKKINEKAYTDSLTSLFNRELLDEKVQNAIDVAKRHNTYITYMMMDIDHFKEYNDTYGHPKGDIALTKVAKCLKSHTNRADDSAFRIGGEEFVLTTLGMDEKKSLAFANLIRKDIIALEIEHNKNSAHKFLTISIGLYIDKGEKITNKKKIYDLADSVLYKSKLDGRNMISTISEDKNE